MDPALEHTDRKRRSWPTVQNGRSSSWLVVAIAIIIFGGCAVSPPSLMDDVDSVQAVIARNMLSSGDWVTATLDGVKYLEKAAGWYWSIAGSFRLFGVHDWVARIPVVLSAIVLCWLICRITQWAGSKEAGVYAGIVLATSAGLFLFTRILIPDVCLTLCISLSLWSFLRAIEPEESHSRAWACISAAAIACGILLKGLIACVFPLGIATIYLLVSGQWRERQVWRRLHLGYGLAVAIAIAAPWHILATLRNPPYFVATLHSGPGQYRGFAWFYFVNEHLLRFLDVRYPRDYNTVPRLWFWLLHLVWLFPWSVFLPSVVRLRHGTDTRACRLRLLALIWIGFVLTFFTFSTTQEYYSMPCYPAFALLIGMTMASPDSWLKWSLKVAALVAGLCFAATLALLFVSWQLPTPGDIAQALTQHPSAYTLSLGHMGDLTIAAFAYLRLPLLLACVAFLLGSLATALYTGRRAYLGLALMMILLLHAARLAMVVFDPYLSSRPLAQALLASPPGQLIFDDQFYTFSSVAFYTDRKELLLNGRVNNLEYGSNAPGAPHVFISNQDLRRYWKGLQRFYLLAEAPSVPRLAGVVGRANLYVIAASGGKYLFSNQP